MAGQDGTACYTCEGTLLVPTVDDRVSHWRERLVSGNRLTIVLKVGGERWSSDACFLLWGENCLQEKMFEVNLRFVRDYSVRTRTWHEITSSDRRRFALNFHDSNQFARFYEELESTLSFLKKLTTATTLSSDAGGIVVLRVDKLPPPKPPRAVEQTPSPVEARTHPLEEHRGSDRQPWRPKPPIIPVARGGSTVTIDDVDDVASKEEVMTTWYVNISDGGVTKLPESKCSDDFTGIYETIADPTSSPHALVESDSHVGINTYDHISDVLYNRPCGTKPIISNDSIDFSDEVNGRAIQGRPPVPRKPIETHIYDDRDSYDNIALDFTDCHPVATQSKPKLRPLGGELLTRSRPTSGVANDASRHPAPETGITKPQPLPRAKKPKEEKSSEDDWACSKCTLINPTTTDRCAACDMTRHRPRVPPVTGSRDGASDVLQRLPSAYIVPSDCFLTLTAEDENWTCSVCSAANRRESDVCHSCSAWICSHCTLHNQPELWVCSVCSHSRLLLK